jgi:hypothetical protein
MMFIRILLCVAALLCLVADAEATGRRGRQRCSSGCSTGACYSGGCSAGNCSVSNCSDGSCSTGSCSTGSCSAPVVSQTPTVKTAPGQASCDDALAEVNAARAQRGLKPYVNDPVLNAAARKCAEWRAARLCEGHCSLPQGDFTFLEPVYPVGTCVGGCAAWEPSWGWGACATYDGYTYCGAAWKLGADGKRYMHLFCR